MIPDYKFGLSFFDPDPQKLVIGQVSHQNNQSEVFSEMRDFFLQIEPGSEIKPENINQIFETFKLFLTTNSNEIVTFFTPPVCEQLLAFLNYDIVELQIKIFYLIGTICMNNIDYVSFFCDRELVQTALTIFSQHTHDFFSSCSFLFSSLLRNCASQLTFQISNEFFPSVINYAYSILRGLELEEDNFRQSGIFFYFLLQTSFPLPTEITKQIYEAVVWQMNWMAESPFPSNIFVFTMWNYFHLLYNNKGQLNEMINVEQLQLLCRFFEDDYEIDLNTSNNEQSPLNPLFAIFTFLFTIDHSRDDAFLSNLYQTLLESFSFRRLINLTSSENINYSVKAFEVIKQILIKHPELTQNLLSLDLFDALEAGMENHFSIKEHCYETIIALIQTQLGDIVLHIFQSNLLLLVLDFVSTLAFDGHRRFLFIFKSSLELISNSELISTITALLDQNERFEQLEEIFEDQDDNLIIPIKQQFGLLEME